ncbi:uncharacterized protein LOC131625003 [Vicia villosa]|uniref:uncharacterized protein LOC131625003 n=1 Tax=Vicia villosa TaxID=3911 RepID=UPI00273BD290|nr:uncharacterized protein LOC131625003 [Vicia villosa]
MDKGNGGGHGETTDPDDHSHRNKADDAFLAEEDEDYDELYGDIYIDPDFLQPSPVNKASEVKNNEVERKKPPPPPQQRPFLPGQNAGGVSLPGTSGIRQKQPFVGGGSRLFYLGGLHWWTTDADVEYELCRYGKVREVRFLFDRTNGKSKGYCKVEFYDPLAAAACMKGLVGHSFNGRPCVVSLFWTPFLDTNQPDGDNEGMKEPDEVEATKRGDDNDGRGCIKEGGDGDNQGNKESYEVELEAAKPGDDNGGRGGSKEGGNGDNEGKKGPDEVKATKPGDGDGGRGGINQCGDGDNRGNWGRGSNLEIGNRGHGNPVRNRGGGMGGRSIMMGGAAPRMLLHPRMGPMSRMYGYAGFPGGSIPPFPGNSPSYPGVGLRGLAPYRNYSFYGRGMPMSGMGMIPPFGMYGPNMGMWPGPDMGRWGGDEHGGGKVAGSGYGEKAASDHRYDEEDCDRGDSPNAMRDKDRGSEGDSPSTSENDRKNDLEYDHEEIGNLDDRKISRARSRDSDIDRERSRSRDHVPDRERGLNRERHTEDRGGYADHHRFTDHAPQLNDEQERGRSSRPSIKSRKYSHNGKRR